MAKLTDQAIESHEVEWAVQWGDKEVTQMLSEEEARWWAGLRQDAGALLLCRQVFTTAWAEVALDEKR